MTGRRCEERERRAPEYILCVARGHAEWQESLCPTLAAQRAPRRISRTRALVCTRHVVINVPRDRARRAADGVTADGEVLVWRRWAVDEPLAHQSRLRFARRARRAPTQRARLPGAAHATLTCKMNSFPYEASHAARRGLTEPGRCPVRGRAQIELGTIAAAAI